MKIIKLNLIDEKFELWPKFYFAIIAAEYLLFDLFFELSLVMLCITQTINQLNLISYVVIVYVRCVVPGLGSTLLRSTTLCTIGGCVSEKYVQCHRFVKYVE